MFYVGLAAAFGAGLWMFAGGRAAGEFLAGYVTEYSLSVDNLFVFVVIMTAFAVPVLYQHRVLLAGIVIALVMRGVFIAVGAAAINAFSWVIYPAAGRRTPEPLTASHDIGCLDVYAG